MRCRSIGAAFVVVLTLLSGCASAQQPVALGPVTTVYQMPITSWQDPSGLPGVSAVTGAPVLSGSAVVPGVGVVPGSPAGSDVSTGSATATESSTGPGVSAVPGSPAVPGAPAVPGEQPSAAPGQLVTAADRHRAAEIVAAMSVPQQAASVVMPIADLVQGSIGQIGYGGVILMGTKGAINGAGASRPADIRAFTDTLQAQRTPGAVPLLIAIDQEYGAVQRLRRGFTSFPNAQQLRELQPLSKAAEFAEKTAAAAGLELRAVGITVNFAPVADVLPERGRSALAERSYGSDPQQVATILGAAVGGYQSAGIAATVKHFPGIGRSATDTHHALATLQMDCASWAATEYRAFQGGVAAHTALVMTGHAAIPAATNDGLPASISPDVVGKLLRGNGIGECPGLGYQGVTVTDSMLMAPIAKVYSAGEAAWRAVAAGEDLVLMPTNPKAAVRGIAAAVSSGQLSAERLAQAATSVMALRIALARFPQPDLAAVPWAAHAQLAARLPG